MKQFTRIFFFISIIILLSSASIFSQNSFTAKLVVQPEIVQGEYTEIKLDIYKPQGARNYIVFTQKLPVGFFVKMEDAKGATYVYENNLLTITWFRCPSESKFSVNYKIASMVGISGKFNLSGKLKYMVGAEQAIYDVKPQAFTLVKEKNKIVANSSKNISDNKNKRLTNNSLKDVMCKSFVTYNKKNNIFYVELKMKSNKKGDYNIVETIPKNFEFIEVDSQDAKVNKSANLVQFIWEDVAFEKGTTIKYQLKPKNDIKGKPIFSGKLSFLKDGKILNMSIQEN